MNFNIILIFLNDIIRGSITIPSYTWPFFVTDRRGRRRTAAAAVTATATAAAAAAAGAANGANSPIANGTSTAEGVAAAQEAAARYLAQHDPLHKGWTDKDGVWHDSHGDKHEEDWETGYYDAFGNWIYYEAGKAPKENVGGGVDGMGIDIKGLDDDDDDAEVMLARSRSP